MSTSDGAVGASRIIGLLVGMHFRPPAQALLRNVPAFAPVILSPEPDNQYDWNAVQVLFEPRHIPEAQRAQLEQDLALQGFELAEVLARPEPWQLGYLAKTGGKPLLQVGNFDGEPIRGNSEIMEAIRHRPAYQARLIFGLVSEALVEIYFPEEAAT